MTWEKRTTTTTTTTKTTRPTNGRSITTRLASESSSSPSSESSVSEHDFSSPYFWEDFYQRQLESIDQLRKRKDNNNNNNKEEEDINSSCNGTNKDNETDLFVFEWHDSISLQDLANLIPSKSNCLMVGCGNSQLPQVVLDHRQDDEIHMTLLDTSQTCIDQLEAKYSHNNNNNKMMTMSFVCGSATEMSSYFLEENNNNPQSYFDCIVDKGLTDAFMCGSDWERPVKELLIESTKLFEVAGGEEGRDDGGGGGIYILISYKITDTIQEYLQELCDEITSNGEGGGGSSSRMVWEWEFDTQPLSNERVSVSLARVRPTTTAT